MKPLTKIAGFRSVSQRYGSYQNVTDPQHRKMVNSCCLLVREDDAGDKVTMSQSRRGLLTAGEAGDYQPKSDAASGQQVVGKDLFLETG